MDTRISTLIQKFQQGHLSLREEIHLAELISDPNNKEVDKFLRDDFQNDLDATASSTKNMKHVLHAIHHRIHLNQSARRKNSVYQIYHFGMKAAASLFIPMLLLSIYLLFSPSGTEQLAKLQIVAPEGSRINFVLPDGTKGILNGGSKLDYSPLFAENRNVKLLGEAYFDVAHDTKHPFIIDANKSQIEVVGTRFTLTAWPDENQTELVLEEGKVLFTAANKGKSVTVIPGQRIVERNGELERNEVETWKYTGWKDGKLIFRNDSMNELARRISRWYNVDVEYEKNIPDEYTFRGVFEGDSLEEVLRLLALTSPIEFKVIDRQANPDGTYTHKKVMITKK